MADNQRDKNGHPNQQGGHRNQNEKKVVGGDQDERPLPVTALTKTARR